MIRTESDIDERDLPVGDAPTPASLAQTLAHVTRLDLLLRREVLRFRQQQPHARDETLRGLYISEDDVDELLKSSLAAVGLLASGAFSDEQTAAFDSALASVDAQIAEIETSARQRGDTLRLDHLAHVFGLSPFERSVIVVALAAELDLKYERLFAYLQDDVTKKRPTVDLVLRLLCSTVSERLHARQAFTMDAPLLRWELITLAEDSGARHPVLLARYLKLDERIAAYLTGADTIDSRLASLAGGVPANERVDPGVREQLHHWARRWVQTSGASVDQEPVVCLHGSYGTGRRASAAFLATSLGCPCLLLN